MGSGFLAGPDVAQRFRQPLTTKTQGTRCRVSRQCSSCNKRLCGECCHDGKTLGIAPLRSALWCNLVTVCPSCQTRPALPRSQARLCLRSCHCCSTHHITPMRCSHGLQAVGQGQAYAMLWHPVCMERQLYSSAHSVVIVWILDI